MASPLVGCGFDSRLRLLEAVVAGGRRVRTSVEPEEVVAEEDLSVAVVFVVVLLLRCSFTEPGATEPVLLLDADEATLFSLPSFDDVVLPALLPLSRVNRGEAPSGYNTRHAHDTHVLELSGYWERVEPGADAPAGLLGEGHHLLPDSSLLDILADGADRLNVDARKEVHQELFRQVAHLLGLFLQRDDRRLEKYSRVGLFAWMRKESSVQLVGA